MNNTTKDLKNSITENGAGEKKYSKAKVAVLPFFEGKSFQEGVFARQFLKAHTVVRVGEELFRLCKVSLIWERLDEDELKRLAFEMFEEEGPYQWRKRFEQAYYSAIRMLAPRIDKIDPYPYKINFKNKVYDFQLMEFKEKDKSDYFTYEMGYSIPETPGPTPYFDSYLNSISLNRKELKEYLLTFLAYIVSSDKKLQKFFILFGKGNNGKSLFLNTLIKLLGENFVTSIGINQINGKFALSKAINKKLIVASENESSRAIDTECLKKLSGDDLLEIEQKYRDPYSARLSVETVFAVNNVIRFNDNSQGLRRRLEVIPFDLSLKPHEVDIDLGKKLESELPDIMAKLIQKHKEFAEAGYRLPYCEEVEKAKKDFLDQGIRDSLGSGTYDFLEEHIIVEEGARVSKKAMYNAYYGSTIGACNQTKFWIDCNKYFKTKGIEVEEINNGERYKVGIRLNVKEQPKEPIVTQLKLAGGLSFPNKNKVIL